MTPSEINAGGGTSVVVTAHAIRKDGFAGDIALALTGAPPGFTLSGGVVPAGQDHVRLTLNVPPMRPAGPIPLRFEARATIQGKPVVHPAPAAEEMMQAFAYRHLVPADSVKVTVIARGGTRVPARYAGQRIGEDAGRRVACGCGRRCRPCGRSRTSQLELSEPPEGVTLRDVSVSGNEARSSCSRPTRSKAEPGLARQPDRHRVGRARAAAARRSGRGAGPAARRRVPIGTLPAIPFEIIPPR